MLQGMRLMGVLSAAEEQRAEQEDVRGALKYDVSYRVTIAPHFVDWVMSEVEQKLGAAVVQQGGLRVYTTLDLSLQNLAQKAVAAGVSDLRRYGVNNGDLLAVRPSTGEILAWVGSADYTNDQIGGQFNVVRSARQPGSSFKPYVYEAALRDRRITLCTTLQDRATDFDGYRPLDYDNRFMGPMTASRALLLSRNVPAVEVAKQEGMDRVISLAQEMVSDPQQRPVRLEPGLATAIGASELTMYQQVQGYAVFANQGRKMPLIDIARVENGGGDVLYQQAPGRGEEVVLSPAQAYLITNVLKDYPKQWSLGWSRTMAGKSGTTGGAQSGVHPDAWMMAYSPDIVVGAWAGNTAPDGKGRPTTAFGVNVGQTISARFINGLPRSFSSPFSQPQGLVTGPGGQLFLPGTQSTSCSGGGQNQGPGRGNDQGDRKEPGQGGGHG